MPVTRAFPLDRKQVQSDARPEIAGGSAFPSTIATVIAGPRTRHPFQKGRWWDPYNQSVLKGDYPIKGNSFS